MKERNKKCFKLSNKRGTADAKIGVGRKRRAAVGIRQKREIKKRRVRKAMIPSHDEAKA